MSLTQQVKLAIGITGVPQVVGGLKQVEGGLDSAAGKAQSATARMNSSLNQTQTATGRLASAMTQAEGATGRMAAAARALQGAIAALALGAVIVAIIALGKASLDAGIAMERLQAQIEAAAGSSRRSAAELAFIRDEAKRLGLSFQDTAASYAKFMAATRNTPIEGEQARRVFVGVSEAVTALRLTTDESNGIFLALSQMMSKGRVSAEELTQQLGERLPGALGLAADAMGMTKRELLKQMEQGKIMAEDLLPKLAQKLHETYGDAAEKAASGGQGAINRFNNALFETKAALGTALLPAFTFFLENGVTPVVEKIKEFIGGLEIIAIKVAALPDKLKAAAKVALSGKGLFTYEGRAEYDRLTATTRANEEAAIMDLMANKYGYGVTQPPSSAPSKPKGPSDEEIKKAEEAAKKAAEELKRYLGAIEGFNAQIRATNPNLTDLQKRLLDVDAAVKKAIESAPNYVGALRAKGAELKRTIVDAHNLAEAIRRTSEEFKEYLRLTEEQAPQHGDLAGRLLAWAEELEQVKAMNPDAEFIALSEQIERLEKLMAAIPERAGEVGAAIEELQRRMREGSEGKNEELQISTIQNPYERQLKEIENFYRRERELETARLKQHQEGSKRYEQIIKRIAALDRAETEQTARLKMQLWAGTAAFYGNLMGDLAGAMDQANREQFEAAKALSIGQTVMNTGAAIMQAMATLPPPASYVAAGVAAATGALQIAKISSTQYGSASAGGGISAPAGFAGAGGGAGGIGASMRAPIVTIRDSQGGDALARLAASADNASLALGKVADGLTSLSGLFGQGRAQMAVGGAPNRGVTLSDASRSVMKDLWTLSGGAAYMQHLKDMLSLDLKRMLLSPINFVSNLVKGTVGVLFGGGTSATGAGIELGIGAGGLLGRTAIDYKRKGGVFRKSKRWTDYGDLDPGFDGALQAALAQVIATIDRSAAIMGTRANIAGVNIPFTRIATAGRTPEEIGKDLEDWFTKAADALGQTVAGLREFTFYGESAFDALVRLSTSLQSVNERLELIGHTLLSSTLAGADAAYRLQELMGGAEAFGEAVDTYFEAMFSEKERDALKVAQAVRQVNTAFGEMGLAVPATREQFRAIVEGLDLTTDRGAALFAALMDISDEFGVLAKAADQAREALRKQIEGTLDIASTAANALRDILGGPLGGASPEALYAERFAAFNDARQAGRLAELPELGKALLEASRAYNASGAGYQADLATVTRVLGQVAGIGGSPTLSAAERQVQLLDDIRKAIEEQNLAQIDLLAAQTGLMREMLRQYLVGQGVRPSFAVGSPFVPRDMTADIHRGEMILDSQFAASLRRYGIPVTGAGDNKELIAEIRELRKEVAELIGHAAAGVRVNQYGFGKLIATGEEQAAAQKELAAKARLESAA